MRELLRESAAGFLMAAPIVLLISCEFQSGPERTTLVTLGVLPLVGFGLLGVVRLLQKYEKL